MTVQERLKIFITKHLGMKISAFELKNGWSNGSISNTKVISLKRIESITLKYPELNPCWLYFGEGEMIKKEEEVQNFSLASEPESKYHDHDPCDDYKILLGRLKEARNTIKEKDDRIAELNRELGELKPKKNNSGSNCA